jgi:hypothetical protein
MSTFLNVIIQDEMDPVLAIVVGEQVSEPVVYRDYRGIYDRPVTYISVRDFAEWVVIEHFEGAKIIASSAMPPDVEHAEENFIRFATVVIEQ